MGGRERDGGGFHSRLTSSLDKWFVFSVFKQPIYFYESGELNSAKREMEKLLYRRRPSILFHNQDIGRNYYSMYSINFCIIFCKVLYIPFVFSKIRPVLCVLHTIVESQITRPFLCKSYNINVNISILRPSLLVHTIILLGVQKHTTHSTWSRTE